MLDATEHELSDRAQRLRELIGIERAEIVRSVAKVGGGALPLVELEGPAVALAGPPGPAALARALRRSVPAVIGRIHDDRVLLDPRTLTEPELEPVAHAARAALQPRPAA
jgi:L-seryl-tRNA(Ser) seleniumtransferase